ncbi:hypothetical protein NL676_008088 [Syzygium grande]|nr:hypothetical protein NL676_008088 [Syzygium grande]
MPIGSRRVFNETWAAGVVSWSSLVVAHVRAGELEFAREGGVRRDTPERRGFLDCLAFWIFVGKPFDGGSGVALGHEGIGSCSWNRVTEDNYMHVPLPMPSTILRWDHSRARSPPTDPVSEMARNEKTRTKLAETTKKRRRKMNKIRNKVIFYLPHVDR